MVRLKQYSEWEESPLRGGVSPFRFTGVLRITGVTHFCVTLRMARVGPGNSSEIVRAFRELDEVKL